MLRRLVAALVLGIAVDAAAQVCSVPSFSTGGSFAAGTDPSAIAAGDFNGDGLVDLAVSNYDSNDISVLLSTGRGQFAPPASFPTGGVQPDGVATADFNEDGRLDLAAVNRNSGSVAILLGNGSGGFSVPMTFAVGSPRWIAVGDFNGDHHLDLAVAGFSGVTILLGNGTGTFGSATNFAVGTSPSSIAAADLSGDGHVDLVVANTNSENVSVLLGTGTGSFASATNYRSGNAAPALNPVFPNFVVVGDFNGDGRPDLAVSNFGTSNVSILTGLGGGLFAPAVHFPLAATPHAIGVVGRDLAAISDFPSSVTLLLNACPIPALSPLALLFLAAALLFIGIKWSRS